MGKYKIKIKNLKNKIKKLLIYNELLRKQNAELDLYLQSKESDKGKHVAGVLEFQKQIKELE